MLEKIIVWLRWTRNKVKLCLIKIAIRYLNHLFKNENAKLSLWARQSGALWKVGASMEVRGVKSSMAFRYYYRFANHTKAIRRSFCFFQVSPSLEILARRIQSAERTWGKRSALQSPALFPLQRQRITYTNTHAHISQHALLQCVCVLHKVYRAPISSSQWKI